MYLFLQRRNFSYQLIVLSSYSNCPIMANFKDHGFRSAVGKAFNLDEQSAVKTDYNYFLTFLQ